MKTLIVSQIEILQSEDSKENIKIERTDYKKCDRCWMYFDEQSFTDNDPNLCLKCCEQMKKTM